MMISLDSCVKDFPENQGIHISHLVPFQGVQIQTQNNPYSLFVLEPSEGKVLVRGGQYFPVFKEAYLCGSTWGGSILRLGWIGLGMCLEIYVDGIRIVTTPLKAFSVEEPPPPRVC
jgi:hypothetical protein